MCIGSTAASPASTATYRGQQVFTPSAAFSKPNPLYDNPSFDFRTFTDSEIATYANETRSQIEKLNAGKPQEPTINWGMAGKTAGDAYRTQLANWEQASNFWQKRQEAIQQEQDRRDAPRRLAEERRALIAQQQAEAVKYERQMADQQAQQVAQTEALRAQQAERIDGIRARGQAVTQSLQILGQQGSEAPTAAMTKRVNRPQGARSTSASLRMGATSNSAGSGANISV